MSRPPRTPGPSDPQQPDRSAQGRTSAISRRPSAGAVACGLFVVVLVLSLVGFFGTRALLGDDESAERSSAPQQEQIVEGQWGEAA